LAESDSNVAGRGTVEEETGNGKMRKHFEHGGQTGNQ
jgi:hypothetical protein